jgi:hypothetical protein
MTQEVPVRLFGFTLRVSAEEAAPIRKLDPFFLQGTASSSNMYMYLSRKFQTNTDVSHRLILRSLVLEAPQKPGGNNNKSLYQICISWRRDNDTHKSNKALEGSASSVDRVNIIRGIAHEWAEPFRSFLMLITDATDVKQLDLDDCAPENATKPSNRVMLVGDALHAMTMCKSLSTTNKYHVARNASKIHLQIAAKVQITQ